MKLVEGAHRGWIAAVVLVGAGCGGASAATAPPGGVTAKQTEEMLGGDAPDVAISARLDLLRADPVYGPMAGEIVNKEHDRDALHYFYAIDAVDAVAMIEGKDGLDSALVFTVRGLNANDLPKDFQHDLEKEAKTSTLPSGVTEIAGAVDGHPMALYMTKNALVFFANKATQGAHYRFSTDPSPPPPVDFGSDALFGMWIGPKAFANPSMQKLSSEPGTRGLESVRFVIHTSAIGDATYDARYDTEAHANDAIGLVKNKIGSWGKEWDDAIRECPPLGQLEVEVTSSGRDVHFRLGKLPQVIGDAWKNCR